MSFTVTYSIDKEQVSLMGTSFVRKETFPEKVIAATYTWRDLRPSPPAEIYPANHSGTVVRGHCHKVCVFPVKPDEEFWLDPCPDESSSSSS
jgi:hypothetical protein